MVTAEVVQAYIQLLCTATGTTADAVYNHNTGAWYFSVNQSTIELFMSEQKTAHHPAEVFIRCMAAVAVIPPDIPSRFSLYQAALAINAGYMGFKLSADEQRGMICVIAERPIAAMDYNEFVGLLDTIGFWASQLRTALQDSRP